MPQFRDALQAIYDDWKAAHADRHICAHEYFQLGADGSRTLESICVGIGSDDAAFEELVADCESLVREYVVPFNVTEFVSQFFPAPAFVENIFLDPQLPFLVRPALTKMRPKPHATE